MVYGDGSVGALTISTATNWVNTPPASFNFQYTNVTVTGNWAIPSGVVLRCTGTFTLGAGATITVGYGLPFADNSQTIPGLSKIPPIGYDGGGTGLSALEASSILKPGPIAGGNGSKASTGAYGGEGGGSFSVRAQGAISINGTINVNGGGGRNYTGPSSSGGSGAGGGAGGFIILASQTSLTNIGTITANGGSGSHSIQQGGGLPGTKNGGGGGGGGIVHMLAPSITAGSVSVSGGTGGNSGDAMTSSSGGGGALGGDGGRGAYDVNNTGWAAEQGGTGHIIQTIVTNPENLFL